MFFYRRFFLSLSFFFICSLAFSQNAFAFEVSPTVIDVPASLEDRDFSQEIRVKNLMPDTRMYEAKLYSVSLDEHGAIADLQPYDLASSSLLQPTFLPLSSQEEGVFTLFFSESLDDYPLGVLITEKLLTGQQIVGSFLVLLFPEVSQEAVPQVRIDALSAQPVQDGVEISVQLSNVGNVFAKPDMFVHFSDQKGHLFSSFHFSSQSGRLPVGTTRIFMERVPMPNVGLWHDGSDIVVRFSILSPLGEIMEEAVVRYEAGFGKGYVVLVILIPIFLVGIFILLRRKRGILSA